jgi:putative transcriptional regulator
MNRIIEVLKEIGISQTWLAKKLDKSYNTINEYVRNARQPSLEDLYQSQKFWTLTLKIY